jgi:FkbM family methyltransferase
MWTDGILSVFARRRWRGLRTLLRLVQGGSLPPLVAAATRVGLRFDLDPLNYMDALVLDDGYFEREVLDALLPYAGEGAVLWDVGANIGLHAVTLKRLFPRTAVVCFEPSPFAFARLYANMKANACELTLACVALSDRAGYAPLSLNVWGSTGISSLRPWARFGYEYSFACRCERGEDLVRGGVFPAPTVVKLDVENFEHEVLLGLGGLLDGVRAVVFEDHSGDRAASPIDALLAARGFEVVALPPSDPANRSQPTNFLARRP